MVNKKNISFLYTSDTRKLQNINGLPFNELVEWKDENKDPEIILLSYFLANSRWLTWFAGYYTIVIAY